MRTALLAAQKRTPDGKLRAALTLGGRTVLAQQVQLARLLGCERVLCLCDTPDSDILRLQQQCERDGGDFHVLRGFIQIAALVRSDDDLVVLAEGLVPDPATIRGLLIHDAQLRRVIACLPADSGLVGQAPDDFERIDAERRWAGLLVMRGSPVQHLAECPPDGDVHSLLLRLALQARTPVEILPAERQNAQDWMLVDCEATAEAQQQARIAAWNKESNAGAPGPALARQAARMLAPLGLDRLPGSAIGAAIVLLVGGVIIAAIGMPIAGLMLTACGAFAGDLARVLTSLQERLQMMAGTRTPVWIAVMVDGLTAVTLGLAVNGLVAADASALLGPIAVGVARLAAADASDREASLWSDRTLQLAGFAVATLAGFLPLALGLFSLGAIARLHKPPRND